MNKCKTIHVFGGGVYVKHVVEIARTYGWRVVVRTGARFLESLSDINIDGVQILSGDALYELMEKGGLPEAGDIGISFSAPWIIPSDVIEMFNGALFNLHNQPLPRFRGGGGVSWNILMREKEGGCCVHLLVPEVDAGSIYVSRRFFFPDTLGSPKEYDQIVAANAIEMIKEWLPMVLTNSDPGNPAENENTSSEYWPRLNTELHGWINWDWALADIVSFCQAFSYPHSGAKSMVKGKIVHLLEVKHSSDERKYHPFQVGIVFRMSHDELHVAHRDGFLVVKCYRSTQEDLKIRLGDRFYTPAERLHEAMTTRIQYSPNGTVFHLKK